MVFQGTVKDDDEMLPPKSLNVPVPVLLLYFQGIFQNYLNCFSIDGVSHKTLMEIKSKCCLLLPILSLHLSLSSICLITCKIT